MMKLMHAVVALITILLFLVRDKYACAGVCHIKRRSIDAYECSCGDTSLTSAPLPSKDCAACTLAANYSDKICAKPKYKRDPDIHVEDEYLGIDPHDQ